MTTDNLLQFLSDAGLNPFAVKLLVESYKKNVQPAVQKPISFALDGVKITLEPDTTATPQQ